MPIDPREFAEAAEKLRNGVAIKGEVCARTVAGRAYYAAYLATRQAIRNQYKDPSLNPGHADLYEALKRRGRDSTVQLIGAALAGLYSRRTDADYYPELSMSGSSMTIVVAEAQKVLTLLPNVVGKLPRVA